MQKAHLYEEVFIVNQGVDQAVRGLERLKRAAAMGEKIYGDTLATPEQATNEDQPAHSMQEILLTPGERIRSEIVSGHLGLPLSELLRGPEY